MPDRMQHFLRLRIQHIHRDYTAQDAVAQRFDDFAAFDQRFHRDTVAGAAIVLSNDQVLRDVDQTSRQVTRVRRLQRRVRQAFTSAVCRDEVLQNVQAFAEVGGDRCLDDRAIGLRHQSTHAGQLPNLRYRTARTGVGHHPD